MAENLGGRPTEWSEDLEEQAWNYIEQGYEELDHKVPSVVGLCEVINRSRSAIYKWAEDENKGFMDILQAMKEKQERVTFTKALGNEINATIAKLLLGKHGYSDRVEQETTATVKVTGELSDEELAKIANGN